MLLEEAKHPFLFKTQQSLVLLTGLRAANLLQLRDRLKEVPESSIYHHTHHFLQEYDFLVPEPPNDFAYWVTNVLQEKRIGEELMAIDTVRFRSLNALREAILGVLDSFLKNDPPLRQVPTGQEFYFMKSILFCLPTVYGAHNLSEFAEGLKKVSTYSLYYHIFEARLRKPKGVNDFSDWLENDLGQPELAKKIDRLDPYTYTMEGLRERILVMIERKIWEEVHAPVG